MADRAEYHFDYVIIGNGLAGLQLALEFSSDPYFTDKKFALIDLSPKNANDKTWCFWEKGEGSWDKIVSNKWHRLRFVGPTTKVVHELKPYSYKMIRSIDFYNYAKKILLQNSNIKFIVDEVVDVKELDSIVKMKAINANITCNHVFDSRIPNEYFNDEESTKLIQHFKGWVIETDRPIFNMDEFTVMDYRNIYPNSTSFYYTLPFTSTKALVEFTFFNETLIEDSQYEDYLKNYISTTLNVDNYKVIEEESGQIPMTDFDFSKFNTPKITKIGTAGGWVKGSTGYSFKLTENKVQKIITNIKQGLPPHVNLFVPKYRFYDSIFLRVLSSHNAQGPNLFENFYKRNKPKDYLAFLDESSSLRQEVRIMYSLFSTKFIKALFYKIRSR